MEEGSPLEDSRLIIYLWIVGGSLQHARGVSLVLKPCLMFTFRSVFFEQYLPPARSQKGPGWLVAAPRLIPWPSHFITGAAATAGPLWIGGNVHVFHLINSVYIQLISAY